MTKRTLLSISLLTFLAVGPVAAAERIAVVDVCLDFEDMIFVPTDQSPSGDAFTGVGALFPEGSIPEGGVAACADVEAESIGTFFFDGRFVMGDAFKNRAPDDVAFANWFFRIDGVGTVATTGIVKAAEYFRHTVLETTGIIRGRDEAIVKGLNPAGTQFWVRFGKAW